MVREEPTELQYAKIIAIRAPLDVYTGIDSGIGSAVALCACVCVQDQRALFVCVCVYVYV